MGGARSPHFATVLGRFFAPHNLIHGLKAGIPCWAWVSEGVAVLKNRENLHE